MLVLIRGAGDLASGVALRLWRSGLRVVMTELARPTTIRRTVAFSEAVLQGGTKVEDVEARLAADPAEALSLLDRGILPVLIDPTAACREVLRLDALVDAILAKRNLGTTIHDAPVVIGVGPGFTAGVDCHAVVETMRGHTLGRVYYAGSALPNTAVPGLIGGYTGERVLRVPADGIFRGVRRIGDRVEAGETVGYVYPAGAGETVGNVYPAGAGETARNADPAREGETAGNAYAQPMLCTISGVLRGLLADGVPVTKGLKAGDVDPRGRPEYCQTASDKALAIGGGVLEAILHLSLQRRI